MFIDEAISKIDAVVKENASVEEIMEQLKRLQISMTFSNDYKYYLLMCGIFNQERNPVKFWPQYEKCFLNLVEQDGKQGIRHLL